MLIGDNEKSKSKSKTGLNTPNSPQNFIGISAKEILNE